MEILEGVQLFGASVSGQLHRKMGIANQDAWLAVAERFGHLIVVCDGMGSRSESQHGARMACLAVREAVRYWAHLPDAPLSHLLRLVHVLWEMRVLPLDPSQCATTCLFALLTPTKRLIVAGLGDGIAMVRRPGQTLVNVIGPRSTFTNQTVALGLTKAPSGWSVQSWSDCMPGSAVMLATDGVADDLVEDKLDEFIEYLITKYLPMAGLPRWHALCRDLRDWPTPKHIDDKTIAMLCYR
jgi:serine/threonine protein phosphatase PrpC